MPVVALMSGPRAPTRANGEHAPTVRARRGRRGFGMVDEPYADLRSKGGTIPILRAGPVSAALGWTEPARARSFGNPGECIKRADVGPEPDFDSRAALTISWRRQGLGMGGGRDSSNRPRSLRSMKAGMERRSLSRFDGGHRQDVADRERLSIAVPVLQRQG